MRYFKIFPGVWILFFIWTMGLDPVFAQAVDPNLFKPSSLVSVETSKKELRQVYLNGGQTKTLHCGCFFDNLSQVFPGKCDSPSVKFYGRQVRKILGWMHAMPASVFAGSLKCWKKKVCLSPGGKPLNAADCCGTTSPKFKSMQADMHNLFPAIQTDTLANEDIDESPFGGMQEYQFCENKDRDSYGLRKEIRGDVARAHFYMSVRYKIRIPEEREGVLRTWHLNDPPDEWEEKRNTSIEMIQGNRNPFIDHPELAERVRNF